MPSNQVELASSTRRVKEAMMRGRYRGGSGAPTVNDWAYTSTSVNGKGRVTEGGAPELLQKLAHTYLGPDVVFPAMPDPPAGFVTRITVDRIGGVGPWASR